MWTSSQIELFLVADVLAETNNVFLKKAITEIKYQDNIYLYLFKFKSYLYMISKVRMGCTLTKQ